MLLALLPEQLLKQGKSTVRVVVLVLVYIINLAYSIVATDRHGYFIVKEKNRPTFSGQRGGIKVRGTYDISSLFLRND